MTNRGAGRTMSRRKRLAGLPAATMNWASLPIEHNARRYAMHMRVGTAIMVGGPITAILIICLFGPITMAMLFSFFLLMMGFGAMEFMPDAGLEPTPVLAEDERHSLDRLLNGLTKSCREGMTAADRLEVQRQIDLFAQTLKITFGREPWLLAAEPQDVERQMIPASLRERGMRLARFRELGLELKKPDGMSRAQLAHHCVNMVPLIAAIGKDFGLDLHRYDAPDDDLPGRQSVITETSTAVPSVPISRAMELAQRWITGDNGKVDDLLRIETDAVAGRDMRQLEQAWLAARRAAPGRHDEIDAKYQAYAEKLAGMLQDAITAREQAAIDDLDTKGRYIASKSAVL